MLINSLLTISMHTASVLITFLFVTSKFDEYRTPIFEHGTTVTFVLVCTVTILNLNILHLDRKCFHPCS